jgi:hypothetical protein
MARELTPKQQRFVEEYLLDLDPEQAALRAGYSPSVARSKAFQWVSKSKQNPSKNIAVAVQKAMQARSEKTGITAEAVLERLWNIATADPNGLVEYRRNCCRHCWGEDHLFQWTEGEFTEAQRKADDKGDDPPEIQGGFGFNATRVPHPECPECGGDGRGHVHIHDTRKVKGAARLIYAGVKQGKDGTELKIVDQLSALKQVAEHVGLFRDKDANRRAQEAHESHMAIAALDAETKRLALASQKTTDQSSDEMSSEYRLPVDEDIPQKPIL